MRQKAVVTIESSFSGHLFHRATRDFGYVPILLSADASRYRHTDTPGLVTIEADTSHPDTVIECCRALGAGYEIQGLLTTSSAYAAIAAQASRALGLRGPDPDAIARCLNKFEQRNRIREAGLFSPSYKLVTEVNAATEFAANVGLPVIVKPVIGAGSMGVRLCSTMEGVAEQTRHILASVEFVGSPGVLIEEYITGPEFSVETIGNTVIGITTKHLGGEPFFVETGHEFPARLDRDVEGAIADVVIRALDALELSWGPAHTELRLGPAGPAIIEINPRMAGELIPELVRLAFGIDPVMQTVRLAIGEPVDLTRQRSCSAAIRFVNPEVDGVLRWGEDAERARSVPGIVDLDLYRPDGFLIRRRGDFRDRVGHAIAVADDAVATQAALDKAFSVLGTMFEKA